MLFPFRFFIVALLVLVQAFAPLVHAHTGGVGHNIEGVLHLPELEPLVEPANGGIEAKDGHVHFDVIVGLASAIQAEDHALVPLDDSHPWVDLPVRSGLMPSGAKGGARPSVIPLRVALGIHCADASPRAPPR